MLTFGSDNPPYLYSFVHVFFPDQHDGEVLRLKDQEYWYPTSCIFLCHRLLQKRKGMLNHGFLDGIGFNQRILQSI